MDKTTTPSAGRLHRVLTLALATLLIAGCATGGSRADSLSRQDSDSFTNIYDMVASKIETVTHFTNSICCLTCKWSTYEYICNT